jgi:cytidyltransferase-like protein
VYTRANLNLFWYNKQEGGKFMRITGIIAEFNPFHNGHYYLLQEARKQTACDYLIVIMSGNFTQRGLPTIVDKYTRTKMALSCGADLVLELPTPFATASAQYFADASIQILENTGVVTDLCFGSELGSLALLNDLATILLEEPMELSTSIQSFLKEGKSYPISRALSLAAYFQKYYAYGLDASALIQTIRSPNNILGIEYLQALKKYKSSISPLTIKRKEAAYHDQEIFSSIASATAIRKALTTGDKKKITLCMPKTCLDLLLDTSNTIAYTDEFSLLLHYKLLDATQDSLSDLWDIPINLSHSILNASKTHYAYNDLVAALTSKTYSTSTVQRSLLRILLGVKKQDVHPFLKTKIPYMRVLGCQKQSTTLLSLLTQKASVPVITNTSKQYAQLSDSTKVLLDYDLYATKLYYCLNKTPSLYAQDFSTRFLIHP